MAEKRRDTSDVHKIIYSRIVNGNYPSGYRLVEADLAEEFHVSRTPVRLAIERLVSEGLAKHIPNKGAMVRQLSVDDILGLFQIREVNEGLAARLACKNVTPQDVENLNQILDEMDKIDDLHEYYHLCGQIHSYIFNMSKNEFLSDFIHKIYSITSRYHVAVLCLPGRSIGSKEEHRQMVEAVLSGDENKAEHVMREHIKNSASFFSDTEIRSSLRALSKINWQSFELPE